MLVQYGLRPGSAADCKEKRTRFLAKMESPSVLPTGSEGGNFIDQLRSPMICD